MKSCPLRTSTERQWPCIEEECAWYVRLWVENSSHGYEEGCAIAFIGLLRAEASLMAKEAKWNVKDN